MSLRESSALGKTGFKFENIDFADDAAIATTKLGLRTLSIPLPIADADLDGTSAVFSVADLFIVAAFVDANTCSAYFSFFLPANYVSGQFTVDVYWRTSAVTGNVKLQASLALKAAGDTTAADGTFSTTDAAPTTANEVKKTTITASALTYTADDIVGLRVFRDPADAADTLGANISILGVVVNYSGRG